MPSMPRVPGKGKKIAYKLLGIPANIAAKQTPSQKEADQRLTFQQTARSK